MKHLFNNINAVMVALISIIIIRVVVAAISRITPLWLSLSAIVVAVSAVIGWNI